MPPASPRRIEWLDVARGLAILLVGVHHASLYTTIAGPEVPHVQAFSNALQTVRMPLFFLVSGLLCNTAIGWGRLTRGRIIPLLYVYTVWSLAAWAIFSIVPWYRDLPPGGSLAHLIDIAVAPRWATWYLLALAIFLALARVSRRIPTVGLLLLAALVSLLTSADVVTTTNFAWDGMLRYFFFFALGARTSLRAAHKVAAAPMWLCWCALFSGSSALVAVAMISTEQGMSLTTIGSAPAAFLILAFCGTSSAVALCVILTRTPLTRPLAALGRRTLTILVLHDLLLGCLAATMSAGQLPDATAIPRAILCGVGAVALAASLSKPLSRVPGALSPPPCRLRRPSPKVGIPEQPVSAVPEIARPHV